MTLPSRVETFEIDGKTYSLTWPALAQTRKVMDLVHRIAPMLASLEAHGLGDIFGLAAGGHLDTEEIAKLTDLFAPLCSVDLPDDRQLRLNKPEAQQELWGDGIEVQYDWLTQCFRLVFGGILGKSKAVVEKMAAAKTKAKLESLSQPE